MGIQTEEKPQVDAGKHDEVAHVVDEAEMIRAFVTGEPIQALCGVVWVPSRVGGREEACAECLVLADFFDVMP